MHSARIVISRLLLLLFIAVQFTTLHELDHENDSHDCELCVVIHDFQSESFSVQPQITIVNAVANSFYKPSAYGDYAFAKAQYLQSSLSIRPPPVAMT